METTQLNDTIFQSLSYDEMTRELHIRYSDGAYIIFYEVPKVDYLGFLSSSSYSDFFKEKIESRFRSKKIK